MKSSSKEPPAIDADALLVGSAAREVNRAMGAPSPEERAADLSEKRRRAAYARWGGQAKRAPSAQISIDAAVRDRINAEFGVNAGRALTLGAEWALNHAQEIKMMFSALGVAFLPAILGASDFDGSSSISDRLAALPLCSMAAASLAKSPFQTISDSICKTSVLLVQGAKCLLCQLRENCVADCVSADVCDIFVARWRLHNLNFQLSAFGAAVSPRPFSRRVLHFTARFTERRLAHHVNPGLGLA